MIGIKEAEIESMLKEAIHRANVHQEDQIVSITEKINRIHPIHFFQAAKQTNKNRIFWTNHTQDFVVVGIGNACKMIAKDSRFEITERRWTTLVNEAIIHNPYKVEGTGILSFGGMSFDPRKKQSNLWKKFPPIQMVVPEFTLIKNKDDYYFTTTIVVHKNDQPMQMIQMIDEQKELLFDIDEMASSSTYIIKQEEIETEQWMATVEKAIKEIKENRAKKIVLAREMRLQLSKDAEIGVVLQKLIETQENSYVFAFEQGEDCFVGASPERLVKIEGNQLLSTCLAGTAPRGKTITEDKEIAKQLLSDDKNLEEHLYVVRMIKSKIKKYCTNINIPEQPIAYPLKNLQHLYTPVSATLKPEASVFNIIKEIHPTPALGGVPREKSLHFIREHELLDRGWYGAPIGWIDSNHNGEFAVAIRSGLIQGNEVSLFAGCGVMKDSDPFVEYEETNMKFLPMLNVLEDNDEPY